MTQIAPGPFPPPATEPPRPVPSTTEIRPRAGPSPVGPVAGVIKRLVDLVGAASLLLLTSPLWLLSAIALRLEGPGSVFYRGERLGLGGERISVYKFRSMVEGADSSIHRDYVVGLLARGDTELAHDVFKIEADPRVTRIGRWLRATSIDELPQLLNVLAGEMSLVGPRPEVPYALEAYAPWMYRRFAVRPGLTGLWQVRGRGSVPPLEMLRLDVAYADEWSLALDLRILLATPRCIVDRSTR